MSVTLIDWLGVCKHEHAFVLDCVCVGVWECVCVGVSPIQLLSIFNLFVFSRFISGFYIESLLICLL